MSQLIMHIHVVNRVGALGDVHARAQADVTKEITKAKPEIWHCILNIMMVNRKIPPKYVSCVHLIIQSLKN